MKVQLSIEASDGSFSDDMFPVGDELARIFHRLANQVHGTDGDFLDGLEQPLHDSDRNVIGALTISG